MSGAVIPGMVRRGADGRKGTRFPASSSLPRKRAESIAENHLDDQSVGAGCQSRPDAKVEFPARAEIDVDYRNDQVLLLAGRIDVGDRAEIALVLQAGRDA